MLISNINWRERLPGDFEKAGFLHIFSHINDAAAHDVHDKRPDCLNGTGRSGYSEYQLPSGCDGARAEDWSGDELGAIFVQA